MSAALGERAAWDLVRALQPGSATPGSPARVRLPAHPDAVLDVEADGSWQLSCEASPQARDLLDLYLPVRVARHLVVAQLGQSLDGRIATESGASHFVTGDKDIERLHRLRALVDAVIVGANTVASDDPRLTVRLAEGPNPVRIVLDPSGRLAGDRRVFSDSTAPTLVVRGKQGEGPPSSRDVEELTVPWSVEDGLDLGALLETLRSRGLKRVLVEGGGVTVSRFLKAGLLDRLHLTVAPLLIGSGRASLTLDPIATLEGALRPACRRFTLGDDVLFDLEFRAPPT